MPRKRVSKGPLHGLKATVALELGVASIRVDGVNAVDVFTVLADLLSARREAVQHFPELLSRPDTIPGSCGATYVPEADDEECRRVGFRIRN